jgi:hypothetical protein
VRDAMCRQHGVSLLKIEMTWRYISKVCSMSLNFVRSLYVHLWRFCLRFKFIGVANERCVVFLRLWGIG